MDATRDEAAQTGDLSPFDEKNTPLSCIAAALDQFKNYAKEARAVIPPDAPKGAQQALAMHKNRMAAAAQQHLGIVEGMIVALRRARLITFEDILVIEAEVEAAAMNPPQARKQPEVTDAPVAPPLAPASTPVEGSVG